jgi:hypothetical protein
MKKNPPLQFAILPQKGSIQTINLSMSTATVTAIAKAWSVQ